MFVSLKLKDMDILWLIVILLVIGWALGFFAFAVHGVIHVLLIIAVIIILFRLITGRRL